jgi:hypothetical protein
MQVGYHTLATRSKQGDAQRAKLPGSACIGELNELVGAGRSLASYQVIGFFGTGGLRSCSLHISEGQCDCEAVSGLKQGRSPASWHCCTIDCYLDATGTLPHEAVL